MDRTFSHGLARRFTVFVRERGERERERESAHYARRIRNSVHEVDNRGPPRDTGSRHTVNRAPSGMPRACDRPRRAACRFARLLPSPILSLHPTSLAIRFHSRTSVLRLYSLYAQTFYYVPWIGKKTALSIKKIATRRTADDRRIMEFRNDVDERKERK